MKNRQKIVLSNNITGDDAAAMPPSQWRMRNTFDDNNDAQKKLLKVEKVSSTIHMTDHVATT